MKKRLVASPLPFRHPPNVADRRERQFLAVFFCFLSIFQLVTLKMFHQRKKQLWFLILDGEFSITETVSSRK